MTSIQEKLILKISSMNTILILEGAGLLFVGIMVFVLAGLWNYRPYVEWEVRRQNAFKGLKSTITEQTFSSKRTGSIFLAIFGIFPTVLGVLLLLSGRCGSNC